MTLTDLANHVCAQLGLGDADDISSAKQFLQRRLEMIWATQLWRSSLIEATLTLNPDGTCTLADTLWIPNRATLLLPAAFECVLAVRTDSHALGVASLEGYYRTDTDWLNLQGDPYDFQVLSPAVWEFANPLAISLSGDTAADFGLAVGLRYSPDGVSQCSATAEAANPGTAIGTMLRIDAANLAGKPAGNLALTSTPIWPGLAIPVNNQQQNLFSNLAAQYSDAGQSSVMSIAIAQVTPAVAAAGFWIDGYNLGGPGTDGTVLGASVLPSATQTYLAIYLRQDKWNEEIDNYALMAVPIPAGATTATLTDAGFAFTLNSGPVLNNMTVAFPLPGTPGAVPAHQRIRLTTNPQTAVNLRVLGKTRCPLLGDYDAAPINNAEPCLLAFARADLLLRLRQNGKAQIAMQEGGTLLAQLARSEAYQNANQFRVVPENGFGADTVLWTQPNSFHPL